MTRLHAVATAPRRQRGEEDGRLIGEPVHYDLDRQHRLDGPELEDLPGHQQRWGVRPPACGAEGDRLVDTLHRIGLTGRGGGHFPSAIKWRAVLAAGGGGTVVANGAEGEPASAKDAALLQHRPHLVLDGLACAAEAVGADRAVVWVHEGSRDTHRSLVRALAERRAAGLNDPPVQLATGPRHYLSGESSAVVRALSGGPALPQYRRRPAAEEGVEGRPTLLHNVETLARVAVAARSTAEDYRGTTLLTVVSGRRSVLEVDPSTTLADAVSAATGGAEAAPHAVLLGGYGGSWVRWDDVARLPADEAAARRAGVSLGAGIVGILPPGVCGLAVTAAVIDYLAGSSARQCGPCVFGLRAVADVVADLAAGRAGRADLRRLARWSGEVSGRGACHHPDGGIRLVRTALHTLTDDVHAHLRRRCLHQGGAAARAQAAALFPLPVGAR